MTYAYLYAAAGFVTLLVCARWSSTWRAHLADDEGWLLVLATVVVWPVVWWYALTTAVEIVRWARREGYEWGDIVDAFRGG